MTPALLTPAFMKSKLPEIRLGQNVRPTWTRPAIALTMTKASTMKGITQ
jgi:hypothetical protein